MMSPLSEGTASATSRETRSPLISMHSRQTFHPENWTKDEAKTCLVHVSRRRIALWQSRFLQTEVMFAVRTIGTRFFGITLIR